MKCIRISLCVIMTVVAIAAIFIIPMTPAKEKEAPQKIVLREYNGHMGLFCGEEMLEEFSGVVVSNLPATDRFKLKEGIEFKSIDEALMAAEDYDG